MSDLRAQDEPGIELAIESIALFPKHLLDFLGTPVKRVDETGRPKKHPVETTVGFDGVDLIGRGEHEGGIPEIGVADLLPLARAEASRLESAVRFGRDEMAFEDRAGAGTLPRARWTEPGPTAVVWIDAIQGAVGF